MRRWIALGLALALLVSPGRLPAQPEGVTDPDLAAGIQQVLEGDFETAVATLNAVAKRLLEKGGRSRELARAYVYLAIAYLGLSQETTAKTRFLDALSLDKELALNPQEFPPRVIRLFEEARRDAGIAPARPAPQPTPSAPKKGGSKTLPILLGVGGAAAAGVALAGGTGGKAPTDPSTVDDDRDGFSEAQGDCNDSNPAVKPGGAVTAKAQLLSSANLVGCRSGWRFAVTVTNGSCQNVTVGNVHLSVPRASRACGYSASAPSLAPTVLPGQTVTVFDNELLSCGRGFCSFRFEWLVDTSAGTLSAGGFDVDIVLDKSCPAC